MLQQQVPTEQSRQWTSIELDEAQTLVRSMVDVLARSTPPAQARDGDKLAFATALS